MAHFAKIDDSLKVIQLVVLGDDKTTDADGNEVESIGASYLSNGFGGTWKKTSYNTQGGKHILGGTPYRKNLGQIGYSYDVSRDAFIPQKPHDSWTLNEDTCQWEAPTPYPDDGKIYNWNEETTSWDEEI